MGLPLNWTSPIVSAVQATEWSRWWSLMRSELSRLERSAAWSRTQVLGADVEREG
jgi:hypothetical protein